MSQVQVSTYSLSHIENKVDRIEAQQDLLAGMVGEVATNQDATRKELTQLRGAFSDFLRKDQLHKNLDKAQNALQLARGDFDKSFGHYDEVRRQATGILQALDAGIVTMRTIYQASEEMMLNAPRYWLAPALVALAAWIRDDRVLAERALAESIRREPGKTSLFFTLVLRRHGRTEATSRWLRQYVVGHDPAALPAEFVVVLDAVATGAFGPESRPVVMDNLTEWYERLRTDQDTVQAQVKRWQQLMDSMRADNALEFPVLRAVSPTWPAMEELYRSTTAFRRSEEFFHGIFDGPLPANHDLRRRVDDILTNLVTKFDDEERPLRTKMDKLQAVIDHDGDEELAAKAITAAEPLRDERVDLMTLLTNAAFYPDKLGASRATQRLAVALTGEWIVEAVGRLQAAATAALPNAVRLKIDGWTGAIDSASTEAGLVTSVTSHIDSETEKAVAGTGVGGAGVLGALIGVAALVGGVLTAVKGELGETVFVLLLAIAAGGWTYLQFRKRDERRAELRQQGEHRKALAAAQVNGAVAEARDWWELYHQELGNAERLRGYLASMLRDAHTRSVHHREVHD
jgi:hypothetical protein